MSLLPLTDSDVQGFIDAQNEMRASLGTPAQFGVPTAPQWPAGTKINPDTGEPYDATVVQSNDEFAWTTLTVLIIEKQGSPLRPQADPSFSQSGLREGMDIIADCAVADHDVLFGASTFRVMNKNYQLEEIKPFGLAGQVYRYLVYGAEK